MTLCIVGRTFVSVPPDPNPLLGLLNPERIIAPAEQDLFAPVGTFGNAKVAKSCITLLSIVLPLSRFLSKVGFHEME